MLVQLLVYGTVAYVVMQIFMLVRSCSWTARVLSCLPLALMAPLAAMLYITGDMYAVGPVVIAGTMGLLYLFVVWKFTSNE